MIDDPLPYDHWVEESLRGVVRRSLAHTELHGLPGDHHFYITFRTDADGVEMPGHLHAQHPDEMTIVLQHQFTDLRVGKEVFEVTLSFSGKGEYLRIPFAAVTSFADPSVNFGLQLKMATATGQDDIPVEDNEPVPLDTGAVTADGEGPHGDGPGEEPKTGEVIALDSFRKK